MSKRLLLLPVVAVASLFFCENRSSAQVRTINLDFGNGGAYSGDDGILSSPGGNFWNEVPVTGETIGRLGEAFAFGLRDEFGNAFDFPVSSSFLPFVNTFDTNAAPITGTGEGPLSDGITLFETDPFFGGLVIRELSPESPIEVVVYFASPVGDTRPSDVHLLAGFGGDVRSEPVRSTGGTGSFPGQGPLPVASPLPFTAIDHARFTDVAIGPTTLGDPPSLGFTVGVPEGNSNPGSLVAHIAAIQVRGEFVAVPEPTALALLGGLAICGIAARGRCR